MSFNVNFWTFSKEVNSTARPVIKPDQFACVTNDVVDVLHPRLKMNLGMANNPTAYNYCQVPDWGNRYYWIRSWTIEAGLWVAHCDVDPLASWKTEIGATSAYVLRAAAASDGTIIDTLYPYSTTLTTETDNKGSAFSRLWSDGTYVISILDEGETTFYMMSPTALKNFLNYLFSNSYLDDILGTFTSQFVSGLEYVVDPSQYIGSIMWIPIDTSGLSSTSVNIRVGAGTVNNVNVKSPWPSYGEATGSKTFTIRRHPNAATRGSYLNAAAARYTMDFMPFGSFALDPAAMAAASTLTVYSKIDLRTGAATMQALAGDVLLATASAQVGVPIQVSNRMIGIRTEAAGVIELFGKAIGQALVAGPVGAVTGFIGGIGNVAEQTQPRISTVGNFGGQMSLTYDVVLRYEWLDPVDDDNTHRGRPLCQVRQLSTLAGYQLCANTDVALPASREEIDAIRGFLESGYYYE